MPQPRWPFGSPREAQALADLGIDVVSRANNHGGDYEDAGIRATARVLEAAGIAHAGAGPHLAAAAAPAILGTGARRVAVLAVTTSFAPSSRATPESGDIAGRPGVHGLRYDADITVDAETFETLRASVQTLGAGPAPGDQELEMFGTRIRKGEAVAVAFRVNVEDQQRVLGDIDAARAAGHLVVVSLHSHEPSNASEEPAEFVRDFARLAIDRGASLVVGHGPYRVRGIERRGDGSVWRCARGTFARGWTCRPVRGTGVVDRRRGRRHPRRSRTRGRGADPSAGSRG